MNGITTDKKPLVSFVITYYNTDVDTLKQCLDSIMRLSLANSEREIIVVDDGSDYCPINELSDYADSIMLIRKPNGGPSDARNLGMRTARGEYIQFVDDDDLLIKPNYEQCLDIARYRDPDIVMFDFSTTPDVDTTPKEPRGPVSGSQLMSHENIHAAVWGYFFRRKLADKLSFTVGINSSEDEEFTPQLLIRAERVYRTDTKAYHYRKHANSITTDRNKRNVAKRLGDTKLVIYRLYALCDKLPTADSQAMRRRVAQLTMDYIYNVIVETHSTKHLDNCIDELRAKGLFPLPDHDYTQKYVWFRRMTNTKLGRKLLVATLSATRK